jgi:hypothetical protein
MFLKDIFIKVDGATMKKYQEYNSLKVDILKELLIKTKEAI